MKNFSYMLNNYVLYYFLPIHKSHKYGNIFYIINYYYLNNIKYFKNTHIIVELIILNYIYINLIYINKIVLLNILYILILYLKKSK